MQCSAPGCKISATFLISSIDNGKVAYAFCPLHQPAYVLGDITIDEMEAHPSQFTPREYASFSNCYATGQNSDFVYRTNNFDSVTLNIPMTTSIFEDLTLKRLKPVHFFALIKKYGVFQDIHSDFYNPTTGKALKPKSKR